MDLAKFAKWAIESSAWSGNDLDGGDVQNKAVECGILTETQYDPAIHGESEFEVEPGDGWYVLSDEFKATLPRD